MARPDDITDGDTGATGSAGDSEPVVGNGGTVVDPGTVTTPARRGGSRPGAGRKPRDTAGTSKPTAAKPAAKTTRSAVVSVDALAMIVSLVGNFIAAKAKSEILALDGAESRAIAEASANVAKLYEIPVNEKTAAWVALATTLGTIYGAKLAVIKLNHEIKKGATP